MFKHISTAQVRAMIQAAKPALMDIRDPQSFAAGHIEGSVNVNNQNLQEFINATEFETPIVVICYHGHSSQGAAQYLANYGFEDVYSMDGGFEVWKKESTGE